MTEVDMTHFDQDREVFPFPGKVKSSVWEYFGFYKDDYGTMDKSKAICKMCRRAVNYTGNTTNLRAHVLHHHRDEEGVDDILVVKKVGPVNNVGYNSPPTVITPFSLAQTTPTTDRMKIRTFGDVEGDSNAVKGNINSALFNYIIGEMVPLESIDSQTFRNLIQVIGNNKIELHVPKPDEITAILASNYYMIKQKVAENLSNAEAEYLKLEIWKTVNSSYMTVSVQILNESWKTSSYVLNTFDLGTVYTAMDISDILYKVNQEWSLIDEIIVLSDDSQELVDAAAKLSYVHLTSLGVAINKTATICIAHPVVSSILSHTHDIVDLFKQETTAGIILYEKQKVLKLPNTILVLNEKGSWNSALEMFETFDEQSAAVMASFNDPNFVTETKVKMLTPKEMSIVQSVICMLKPLQTAFRLSHSMKCPSMSVILPVLKKLEVALSSSDCDSQVMVELKDKMLVQLSQGYSKKVHRELLLLSSLLDPRFKDLKFVDPWEQEMAYDLLKRTAMEAKNQFEVYRAPKNHSPEADSSKDGYIKIEVNDDHEFSSCSSEEQSSVSMLMDQLDQISKPVKRRKLSARGKDASVPTDPMNDWLADVVQEIVPTEKQADSVANEISRYKSEMQIMSTSSPLSWWRDRLKTYPILSHIAKKYACAPAIMSDRDEPRQKFYERQRASLSESNLEMMVFLNANMDLRN